MISLGPFDIAKIAGGIIIGAAIAYPVAHIHGKADGRAASQLEAVAKSVEVLRERNEINETVSASTAADLCGSFGLSDEDRIECMRRMEPVETIPQHNTDHPAN